MTRSLRGNYCWSSVLVTSGAIVETVSAAAGAAATAERALRRGGGDFAFATAFAFGLGRGVAAFTAGFLAPADFDFALARRRLAPVTRLCSLRAAASISSFARFTTFFASLNWRRACFAACLARFADFFAACQRSRAESATPRSSLRDAPAARLAGFFTVCSSPLARSRRRARINVHNSRRQNNTQSVMPPLARISSSTSGKWLAPGRCVTFIP